MPPLSSLVPLIIQYKYIILFPGLVFEGPVLTLIAGFLASPAGGSIMSVTTLFFVVLLADITADSLYYCIGRVGKYKLQWLTNRIGLTEKRITALEDFFKKHGTKTIILGKVSHGLGWPAMVGAGSARMPYPKFLTINILVSLGKSFVLVYLGYYYGRSYETLSKYISRTGLTIATFAILLLLIYIWRNNRNRELDMDRKL